MWFTNCYKIWHLELLRGHQLKKTPCTILQANFSYVWHLFLFNLFTRPRLFLFNFFFQDQDVFNKPKLFDDPQMIFQYFPVFARKFFIVIFGQVFGGVQPGCACFILWRHGVERNLRRREMQWQKSLLVGESWKNPTPKKFIQTQPIDMNPYIKNLNIIWVSQRVQSRAIRIVSRKMLSAANDTFLSTEILAPSCQGVYLTFIVKQFLEFLKGLFCRIKKVKKCFFTL